MKRRPILKKALGNERGSILIMAAISMVVLFAFAVLAIDGSMLMTTKNQLQAAADAAALAGASGLLNGSEAEAIDRAINFASYNNAVQDISRPVVITAADIEFPQPDVIRVTTHRTVEKGDALRTFFMRIVDTGSNNLSDVTAVAAARAYDVCTAACIKPWAIPDRWGDVNANGALDPGETYDPVTTGYNAPGDIGLSVVLKTGSPQSALAPGQFYPVDLPPLDCTCGIEPQPGGDEYRDNIANCNPYPVAPGDRLQTENGNMVGPTKQGMQAMIDRDPEAYWDTNTNSVEGSVYGVSPRIALVPFFDPTSPPGTGKDWVRVVKLAAFFLESVGPGSEVHGRYVGMMVQGQPCTGGNSNSFLTGITLIQ
jgi:Flp pilus assembly protein TadG